MILHRPTITPADEHISRHRAALHDYLMLAALSNSCGAGDPAHRSASVASDAATAAHRAAWMGVCCAVPATIDELARLAVHFATVVTELDEENEDSETAQALRALRDATLALAGWQRLQSTISDQQGGK